MIKIKNLEKALNDIGVKTTLEQIDCLCWGKTYRILELELKNIRDSNSEPYSLIFHPTTYQLIKDVTQGERIKKL